MRPGLGTLWFVSTILKVRGDRTISFGLRKSYCSMGIVRNASREGETATISRLDQFTDCEIDMFSTVIIGNQATYTHNNRMITPRGYTL